MGGRVGDVVTSTASVGDDASEFSILVLAVLVAFAVGFVTFLVRARIAREARDAAVAREHALRRQFDAVMSSARDGVLITTRGGDVLLLSDTAAQILGVTRQEMLGRSIARLPLRIVDERMRPVLAHEVFAPRADDKTPRIVGVPGRRGTDDIRWVQVKARLLTDEEDGEPITVTTIMDTSGLREAAEALSRSDAQFRKAMENAPVGMALVDLEWRLMEVNRVFAEMMGSTVVALRGTPFSALSHPQDRHAERDQLQRLYDGFQTRFTCEKRYVRADGHVVWAVLDVGLVRYAGGAPDHYVVQLRDTTDDRMNSELMAHRALHDPLTGLANRTLLQDVLQRLLVDQDDAEVGVVAVDLDGFKGLNDRFGHAAGDNALIHVAGVLRGAAAGRGEVARIGGDEFIVVVHSVDCAAVMSEIADAVHAALRTPLQIKRHQIRLSASMGFAVADDEIAAGGPAALLSAADGAMYRAKAGGKGRTEAYDAREQGPSESQSAFTLELDGAVRRGDLVLHYQPMYDLSTRRVVGFEALVRWQHPTRGLLLPGAFLPLLKDRDLAVVLGTTLVDQAAAFLAARPDDETWVSINVSADQLGNSEFADSVLTAIGRYRLKPQRIVIELTEASLVSPNTRIRHELTELRNAGVPILLDDFGTGVSPLSYLRDLPVSGVKLDMSFVAGIPEDPAGARVSRALGALARELGLATIAEGIETEAQADFLENCGWRLGQGWLFGVAQPAQTLLDLDLDTGVFLIDPLPEGEDDALTGA
ncbi:putative bifunctional diguanylate cyclase/phosphodiesterase [Demequina salsinemoris]|uniref:putative bifunctional diguanylate cyclase/phosphodiesterase n=1 Tax=Demequina salsinemoris TaxID=577470 RepID=UPI0009FEF009|nr:GGDEF domain-containing protein [Demequina salsinemoris]